MYCSRRGREVPRPTDTCKRCGRCSWEQRQDSRSQAPKRLAAIVILIAVMLLAALLLTR